MLSLYIHPLPLHPPSASMVPPSSASTPILGTASPVLSLHIQLQSPCASSASTPSASTSSASTPILRLYIQLQPHSLPQFSCIFSLVYPSLKHLFVNQCNVVLVQIFVHIFVNTYSRSHAFSCSHSISRIKIVLHHIHPVPNYDHIN